MPIIEHTLFKKILYLASITTAIVTILGTIGWIYNEYSEYQKKTETELNNRILELIKNNEQEINDRIYYLQVDLDSLKSDMINGSKYFAVGLRGDGSGRLWYRNEFGELFRAYYDAQYKIYYYINNNGEFIYL